MPALYLECQVENAEALGSSRVIAVVRDQHGQREQVVVEDSYLTRAGGRTFLPVWLISQDRDQGVVQVELPQESASGVNRLWVRGRDTFIAEQRQEMAT